LALTPASCIASGARRVSSFSAGLLDGFGWAVEYLAKEQMQSTNCDDDGTDGQHFDPQQVQEVGLDLIIHDLTGRTMIEPG
jgi:type I restriction-modification system DNA methylase subunit